MSKEKVITILEARNIIITATGIALGTLFMGYEFAFSANQVIVVPFVFTGLVTLGLATGLDIFFRLVNINLKNWRVFLTVYLAVALYNIYNVFIENGTTMNQILARLQGGLFLFDIFVLSPIIMAGVAGAAELLFDKMKWLK